MSIMVMSGEKERGLDSPLFLCYNTHINKKGRFT